LIHGFRDNEHAAVNVECKRSYLSKGNYNVIVVDWSCYAQVIPLRYSAAVAKIPVVGKLIAKFVQFLLYCYDDFCISRVYMIGFSLGAHVAGYAGKCLEGKNSTQLLFLIFLTYIYHSQVKFLPFMDLSQPSIASISANCRTRLHNRTHNMLKYCIRGPNGKVLHNPWVT
jgi:predicted alpha/beta-fold hydrolase